MCTGMSHVNTHSLSLSLKDLAATFSIDQLSRKRQL